MPATLVNHIKNHGSVILTGLSIFTPSAIKKNIKWTAVSQTETTYLCEKAVENGLDWADKKAKVTQITKLYNCDEQKCYLECQIINMSKLEKAQDHTEFHFTFRVWQNWRFKCNWVFSRNCGAIMSKNVCVCVCVCAWERVYMYCIFIISINCIFKFKSSNWINV